MLYALPERQATRNSFLITRFRITRSSSQHGRSGETLSLLANGPTNPATPTGALARINSPAAVATLPSVTVDGLTAPVQYAGLEPSTVGKYRVFFSVPSSLSAGNHSLSLRIANQSSNSVILQMAGQGFPSISSLVNGASHSLASIASPGSIVTLFGSNFGQQDNLSAFPATSRNRCKIQRHARANQVRCLFN